MSISVWCLERNSWHQSPHTAAQQSFPTRRFPAIQATSSRQMEEVRWCLYLPGVCIHAVPVSCDSGNHELHHDLPTRSKTFVFQALKPPPPHLHPAFLHPAITEPPSLPIMGTDSSPPTPPPENADGVTLSKLISHDKAFENTSTSVAASQMRNALNNLADTVTDPEEKKVSFAPYFSSAMAKLISYSSSRLRWTTSSPFSADT